MHKINLFFILFFNTMKYICIEDADRNVSKEVILSDITEDDFNSLKASLHAWYSWRKDIISSTISSSASNFKKKNSNNSNNSSIYFIGPVLFHRDGNYMLRINRWIGTISSSRVTIELKPKFPVKAALNIVCTNAMRNFNIFSSPPHESFMSQYQEEDIGISVAYLLISFVENIIKMGIRAHYVKKNICTVQTRGKILLSKQMIKQKGLLFPVHCQVQDYTYDTIENQYIKAAIQRLLIMIQNGTMHSYDKELLKIIIRKLKEILTYFNQYYISDIIFRPDNLPNIYFDKLNQYYKPACSISSMIFSKSFCGSISSSSMFELGNDDNNIKKQKQIFGSCWLYNMANEFEQFVRDSLKSFDSLSTIGKGHVDWSMQKNQVHMEPDLVLDNMTLIGDVKYRKYSQSKRRPDIFQILAYSNTKISTLQDVVLIYASVESLFLKQALTSNSIEKLESCSDFNEYIIYNDIRENIILICKECSLIVDLLCSWDFEKRIWCCCLNLPESTHKELKMQISHIAEIIIKHLPC